MSSPPPPPSRDAATVTRLLAEVEAGDHRAFDEVLELVYEELRGLAAAQLRRERDGHTLQATALVHEAYFRLVDQRVARYQSRAHFFSVAAAAMRRILTDYARRRSAQKRQAPDVPDDDLTATDVDALETLAVDDALKRLAELSPRQAQVVEMRYFAGLSLPETAEAVGASLATVKRDWLAARAWLQRELGPRLRAPRAP